MLTWPVTDVCLRVWCMIGRVYRSVGDRYLTLLVELFFVLRAWSKWNLSWHYQRLWRGQNKMIEVYILTQHISQIQSNNLQLIGRFQLKNRWVCACVYMCGVLWCVSSVIHEFGDLKKMLLSKIISTTCHWVRVASGRKWIYILILIKKADQKKIIKTK